ncbi:alpha/beta hydrolase fold-3 domain-containing protein [Nemania serpens]|nr:alpha/beta hydrolase fold-3 domain-containing protein [Nemania serpens]
MPTVIYPGRPLKSYPVLNLLYTTFRFGVALVRLPLWVLNFSLLRSSRPLPSWGFQQALRVRMLAELLTLLSRIEVSNPLSWEPGKEKDRWEKLEPFPKDVYSGPLASQTVKPEVIGGTWYPQKPANPATAGPILLHIHGGAFVQADGRPATSGAMFDRFHKHGKVGIAFFPQYRLSSRPISAPFPAAVQDALTSYLYLVRTLGISAENITVSGDSAGGNIAIALLRYLAEYGAELGIPQPKSAVIVAPWVAPVKSLLPKSATPSNPNAKSDFLPQEFLTWGAKTYMKDVPPDQPYVNALGHPFRLPVPTLVTFGGGEILAVDGVEWVKEMSAVEGNDIESYIEADAPHDTVLLAHVLGWEESATKVAEKIGEFIRTHA